MIEFGAGPALVLVPGFPGSWKVLRSTVNALSTRFRVLTMSLGPECSLDADVQRIAGALDERKIDRAIVCGASFGGLVALRFAATHPRRTAALVLASAPGPGFRLRARYRFYARVSWALGPLFVLETPFQLRHELSWRLLRSVPPVSMSFPRMGRRALLMESTDIAGDCRRVTAPTLIVTGEEKLDHVVPVASTMRYLDAIRGARHAVLEETGHVGLVTRPQEFTRLVDEFVRPLNVTAERDSR